MFNIHLCELLHVGRLDVDDVEGLVGDLHVPQVDPEIVCWQISFLEEEKICIGKLFIDQFPGRKKNVLANGNFSVETNRQTDNNLKTEPTWSELTDIELMW